MIASQESPALERVDTCPLCGSRSLAALFRARDRFVRGSQPWFEYSRCRACGVVFESVRPPAGDAARYYPDSYSPYNPDEEGARVRGLRRALAATVRGANRLVGTLWPDRAKRSLRRLYRPPYPGAVLLDFGCGSEAALDRNRARGWRTNGMDFAPQVVARVRAAGHDAWVVGEEGWNAIPDGSITLVRMNHVIEHLYEPRQTLARLRSKLEPGGTIHVATPSASGLGLRLFQHQWYALEGPRHVIIYTPATLRALLEQTGFVDVRILQPVVSKDLLRSLDYRREDRGRLAPGAEPAREADPLAEALLHLPSRVLSLLGRSDHIHAIARAAPARGSGAP